MPETRFDFSLVGIASLLETKRLGVPIYQRSYAWGEGGDRNQVEEFWEDMRSTFFAGGSSEYFLGTVVLSREGLTAGRISIIDGQQRIATTAILLAAIRDEFRARGDDTRSATMQQQYLAKADLRSAEETPQLILNADDDTYFNKAIIQGKLDTPQTRASHKLIHDAYAMLYTYVKITANEVGNSWRDRLLDWVQYLAERVRVITVEVPNESDAFLIFETLNDRGADLTIADLLKNYLFGRAGDNLDAVRNAWVAALANLDISVAGSQLFTDFLRQYWSSKYGATRERELYARIKERITTKPHAIDLSEQIQTASRLYAAIIHSDHEVWSDLGTVDKSNIDVLEVLNLEQNRPLLLAALQHFTPQDISQMLRAMISWGVRGIIVGGIGGGTAERAYCVAAMKVRSGEIKNVTSLRTELANIIPTDDQFRAAFAVARVNRGTLARYLLSALERVKQGKMEPELVPNEDESKVNLEHILPRNPKDGEWGQFTKDEQAAYLQRLGNLALLSKGPNDKIGNKPFAVKRPVLAASQLLLTQEAGNEADWTPAIIVKRQSELADLALKAWPS
jgi:Protein of unknown function DUF262/Protein of unknown function (DUF1524)